MGLIGKGIGKTDGRQCSYLCVKVSPVFRLHHIFLNNDNGRPESVVEQEPRIFVSEKLRNTDQAIGQSVVEATEAIDAAAVKLSRRSGMTHSRKKARTLPDRQRSPQVVENDVSSPSKAVARRCPPEPGSTSQMSRAPRKSITSLN